MDAHDGENHEVEEGMARMTDLSGALESGLWGYHELPGLAGIVPRVEVESIATVRENDFFASKIICSTISGTYLEAGAHILEDGKNLDQYSVEDFLKPAKIIRLPQQREKALIDASLLEANSPVIQRGDALIIDTGWGKMWNKPGYVLQCPNMRSAAIEWVIGKEISIFGVDIPCIEASWSENDEKSKGGLLGALFAKGALLFAPLVNLDKISGNRGTLICLPLKVRGTSGAPTRVIFIEE
jgi:arylformamidase